MERADGFANRLRSIRRDRALRQRDLAEALDLAQTTIANYEQGIRFPDEDTLYRIADFFGISLDYLLGRSGVGVAGDTIQKPELSPEAEQYLELVLSSSLTKAESQLVSRLAAGSDLAELYMNILQPALREIGRLWEVGEVDVGQEHFFSAATQIIMSRLLTSLEAPTSDRVFIGFAISGELHEIGIRMVADLFQVNGWKAVYLGSNLPTPSVLQAIRNHEADVVGISASMPYHINSVSSLIRVIKGADLPKEVKVLVGGIAFVNEPDLWRTTGADGCAPDAVQAVSLASELVNKKQ